MVVNKLLTTQSKEEIHTKKIIFVKHVKHSNTKIIYNFHYKIKMNIYKEITVLLCY